jgi:predicted nucleic acid-binding protein
VRSPTAEALGLPGCRTVVDDLAARKSAASLGIPATGTLGIVLRARSQGIIPATRPVVEDLLRGGAMGGPYRQPFYL